MGAYGLAGSSIYGAPLAMGSKLIRDTVGDVDVQNPPRSAEEIATSKRMRSNGNDASQLGIARNSRLGGRDGGEIWTTLRSYAKFL